MPDNKNSYQKVFVLHKQNYHTLFTQWSTNQQKWESFIYLYEQRANKKRMNIIGTYGNRLVDR